MFNGNILLTSRISDQSKVQAAVVARTRAARLHICERRGIPFLPLKRKIEKDEKGNENNKAAPPRRWMIKALSATTCDPSRSKGSNDNKSSTSSSSSSSSKQGANPWQV